MHLRQQINRYQLSIKHFSVTRKNMAYVWSKKLGIKSEFPIQLGFYFSNRCNLKCRMCRQWGDSGTYGSEDMKVQLPIESAYRVLDEARPYSPELLISGGEPTIYPDFHKFITYAKQNKFVTTIFTNGLILEQHADLFLKNRVDVLCVGLQGLETTHDKIVQVKGAFRKIMAGLRQYEGRKNKPFIKAYVTVTNSNLNDIQDVLALIETHRAIDMTVIQLRWFTNLQIGKSYQVRILDDFGDFGVKTASWKGLIDEAAGGIGKRAGQVIQTIREETKLKKPVCIYPALDIDQIPIYYEDITNNFGRNWCWEPYTSLNIRNTGEVVVCRLHPDIIVGNIHKNSIKEIWEGEKLKRFRKSHEKKGLFSVCSRCYGLYK